MSIEREEGLIVFCCDDARCNEILRTDTEDFATAIEVFDENNWSRFKTQGGSWTHMCADCTEEMNQL